MNIKEVKDLIREVLQSDISEFELEHTGTRIRLKRGFSHDSNPAPAATAQSISMSTHPPQPAVAERELPFEATEETDESDLHIITSPIVGPRSCRRRGTRFAARPRQSGQCRARPIRRA